MPKINNSASTTYSFEGSTETQSATSNTLPINFINNSGLTLTKTASQTTFSAGDIITYTIQITNSSSSYLNGVRIIDNIGGGYLAYVVGSARLTVGSLTYAVNPVATNPLTFTLQQLGVGSTMTLTYKCQVIFNLPSSVMLITNNVEGIGYTASGTINGFANSTIEKKTESDFSITKSSNVTDVSPNQNFNYYLTLKNNTSTPVSVSSITDNLPSNFNLVSVSLKIGNGPNNQLLATDYTLTSTNMFMLPSSSGPTIIVPAFSTTIVTLTGNFD